MKEKRQFKGKSTLFLIAAIALLCVGFIFISCGTDPQEKVLPLGNSAIDFSKATEAGIAHVEDISISTKADIDGKPLTVEAWVKAEAGATGFILTRMSDFGISLYVNSGMPKFAIKVQWGDQVSTTYSADCTGEAMDGDFHHIAGKLTSEDNGTGSVPASCSAPGTPFGTPPVAIPVGSQQPHVECYFDGVLKGCGETFGGSGETFDELNNVTVSVPDPAPGPQFVSNPDIVDLDIGAIPPASLLEFDGLDKDSFLGGVIDDVRFWTVARTQSDIAQCKDDILEGVGGACGIDPSALKGYWRFDEGTDELSADSSGNGLISTLMDPFGEEDENMWKNGWSADTPF